MPYNHLMSNQSLANKYRSTTFDDLVGQDHISHILKYQVAHHTRQANYLFFWPRGTGKTSSARLFAKAINCLNTTDGNPCNSCENCIAIGQGTTMDIMEIDAASHTWVDNIREEIIDKLMYRPTMLKKRVTIIDEVHMLSKGAFNALLKTMEEPSDWMVFILATTELTKVPDTIVSRCQVFNFKKIPAWQIIERLGYIAKSENISTTDEWLHMIAGLSDGCMRDAVKYLDQISVMGEVTGERVSQFLWVVSDSMIINILDHIKIYQSSLSPEDFEHLITEITTLSEQWVDLTIFPKQLMQYADKHFIEDSIFFSQISNIGSILLSQSRRYPHPLLLYKTILYTTIGENNQKEDQNIVISKKTTPSIVPQKLSETIQELSKESENNKVVVNTTEDSPTSFVSLLSPSLQNLLEGQSELTDITDGTAKIIVLNPMAKMMLNKKENHDAICTALTQTSGTSISHVEFSFMSKDEYFKMKMEN